MSAIRIKEEHYRNELSIAATVQQELLPPMMANEYFACESIYVPFYEVGGDSYWYTWDATAKRLLGYVIDVSGHGVSTALQTAALNVVFRQVMWRNHSPAYIMRKVNQRAGSHLQEGFAAAICFAFDFSTMQLTYSAAGITSFLASSQFLPASVTTPGLFIGVLDDVEFEECSVPIQPGDRFYFMTDGLGEVLPEVGSLPLSQFDRTLNILRRLCQGPKALQLEGMHGGLFPWDDATAFCIAIKDKE